MDRVTRAGSAANGTLIRLNTERGTESDELRKQTDIWVDELKVRLLQKTIKAMENDHVSNAGG